MIQNFTVRQDTLQGCNYIMLFDFSLANYSLLNASTGLALAALIA